VSAETEVPNQAHCENRRIYEIPLDRIKIDGTQPRKTFNEQSLRELSESIKTVGLLQPITVKKNVDGTYRLLEGERRLKAHQMAGIPTIRAILGGGDEKEIADRRLAENVVRENLSDIELAKEFQRKTDLGETQEEIAAAIGKSRVYVAQRLSLLRLPEDSLRQLEEGRITFTDARGLATSSSTVLGTIDAKQHGNVVTMENLQVYKLFKQTTKPDLRTLYEAYQKDMVTIRDALEP
jgi:ParB family chromosome partitioning protein